MVEPPGITFLNQLSHKVDIMELDTIIMIIQWMFQKINGLIITQIMPILTIRILHHGKLMHWI